MTESEIRALVRDELSNQGMEVSELETVAQMDGVSVPVVQGGQMRTVPLTAMQKMEIAERSVFGGGIVQLSMEKYNIITDTVATLAIYLPAVAQLDTTVLEGLLVRLTTGDAPNVTWNNPGTAYNAPITCVEGFALQANTSYEISAIWDGRQWTLASSVIVAL